MNNGKPSHVGPVELSNDIGVRWGTAGDFERRMPQSDLCVKCGLC